MVLKVAASIEGFLLVDIALCRLCFATRWYEFPRLGFDFFYEYLSSYERRSVMKIHNKFLIFFSYL